MFHRDPQIESTQFQLATGQFPRQAPSCQSIQITWPGAGFTCGKLYSSAPGSRDAIQDRLQVTTKTRNRRAQSVIDVFLLAHECHDLLM
ncbi:MAG: hypothetical protein CMJ32_07130 [Phycisphaerae bacterium]|nr:hypothetical protein [Phycisphaerae bacterium]